MNHTHSNCCFFFSNLKLNFSTALFHTLGAPKPPTVDPCLPQFQCRLNGQCIPASYKCDFVADCPGGTDEDFDTCGVPQGFEKSVKPWIDNYAATYHFERTNSGGINMDARNDTKGMFIFTLNAFNLTKVAR